MNSDLTPKQYRILLDLDREISDLRKSYDRITHRSLKKYCQHLITSKFERRIRYQKRFIEGGGGVEDQGESD